MCEKLILENTREILKLLKQIKRDGINELITYLLQNNFFNLGFQNIDNNDKSLVYQGALAQHSLNTYKILQKLNTVFNVNLPNDSMIIVGILHDICYLDINNTFPTGHSEKSIFLIQQFIKLTNDEIIAINSHMGYADDRCKQYNEFQRSYDICPLALFLFISDNIEACFYKK